MKIQIVDNGNPADLNHSIGRRMKGSKKELEESFFTLHIF